MIRAAQHVATAMVQVTRTAHLASHLTSYLRLNRLASSLLLVLLVTGLTQMETAGLAILSVRHVTVQASSSAPLATKVTSKHTRGKVALTHAQ